MGKTVLITGAAKRIGAECVQFLHQQGCNVLLHYRSSEQQALALADRLNVQRADSVRLVQGDLLQMQAIEKVARAAQKNWGGIDVLVNNASSFFSTPFGETTQALWDDIVGSNMKAPFFLTQMLAETLRQHQGSVVNVVDIHAERGLPGFAVNSMAKAGLVTMTKVLAKELAPLVRVNAIAPGAILWPEHDMLDIAKQAIVAKIPLARIGSPDAIAKAIWYLIQDADYVTGQVLTVDGGRTLCY